MSDRARVYLVPAEVRHLLGLAESTVRYHTLIGHLRALRIGDQLLRYPTLGLVEPAAQLPTSGVLGTRQVARLLRVSDRTLLTWAGAGTLPMTLRQGGWGISATRLAEWVDEHTDGETDPSLIRRTRAPVYFEVNLDRPIRSARMVEDESHG